MKLSVYLKNSKFITLFFVHLTALVGILSLWKVADAYFFLIFLFVYMLGIYMDIRGVYPIRRILLTLFGFLLSFYFLSFLSLEDLLRPFSHVVLLLLSIKSLEEKRPRDLYQILLLSLFGIAISTAYNLSLSFLLIFLLHSFLGISSLVFLNLYRKVGEKELSWQSYKGYISVSLLFFSLAFSIALPLFFFLPRIQTPLFDLISGRGGLRTGLPDHISLGKVGEIQEDNTVVFRVYGLPQNIGEAYWRAIVFDKYVKNTWIRTREEFHQLPKGQGELVYTLIIEPSFDNIIPALDYPYSIIKIEGMDASPYISTGNLLRINKEINKTIRVVVSSSSVMYIKDNPSRYLDLPSQISPNLQRLARELSKNAKDDMEKLERVREYFSKDYEYTLRLEKYEGDPLDYFLFVSKRGNCEYYASATALLLRMMGIPARVVGGYKGSIWNPFGEYHIITNSMAHVWVEAYINGNWIRVDTTPPYLSPAAQRISSIALVRDYIISFWYSNIIGYSSEKQIRLFTSIGKGIRNELSLENLRKRFLQTLYLVALISTFYLILRILLKLRKTPQNLYLNMKSLLIKEGIIKDKDLPEDLLQKCKNKDYYQMVKFIVSLYQRYKYSPYKVYPDEIKEGYRILKKLRKSIRSSYHS